MLPIQHRCAGIDFTLIDISGRIFAVAQGTYDHGAVAAAASRLVLDLYGDRDPIGPDQVHDGWAGTSGGQVVFTPAADFRAIPSREDIPVRAVLIHED